MTQREDEAWHALFHMVDAFEQKDEFDAQPFPTDYQLNALVEAKRVMELLEAKE